MRHRSESQPPGQLIDHMGMNSQTWSPFAPFGLWHCKSQRKPDQPTSKSQSPEISGKQLSLKLPSQTESPPRSPSASPQKCLTVTNLTKDLGSAPGNLGPIQLEPARPAEGLPAAKIVGCCGVFLCFSPSLRRANPRKQLAGVIWCPLEEVLSTK